MNLNFGIKFNDFFDLGGLKKVNDSFLSFLKNHDQNLFVVYDSALKNPKALSYTQESNIILKVAPVLEDFLSALFNIEHLVAPKRKTEQNFDKFYAFKRNFIHRMALKKYSEKDVQSFDIKALAENLKKLGCNPDNDTQYIECVSGWLLDKTKFSHQIDLAMRYAAYKVYVHQNNNSILFEAPKTIDPHNLVDYETHSPDNVPSIKGCEKFMRTRDGFGLTDKCPSQDYALNHAHYCLICHDREKDTCKSGIKEKQGQGCDQSTLNFANDAFEHPLTGCPLDQKISQMNALKKQGFNIAALAVAMIDNPMIPATGHRICNDCMKACIFQTQDPVDVPAIETQILKAVLDYDYGFEIYSLLTQWNPTNFANPLPKAATGYKILVAGLGPAGFTLAHYLLNEGHTVVGIDGLKIEPLPDELLLQKPIEKISTLYENLDDRVMSGFGGVAEYGITVRWDKNFLKIIRVTLERRARFKLYGSVRLGSSLTISQAFDYGFDHIALCMGAGEPKMINLNHSFAPGVRLASDFLMALQLTGAAKAKSLSNLQIQMPIVVVGGGLTAIDTATEAGAYYIKQVEQFKKRYDELLDLIESQTLGQIFNSDEKKIVDTFLSHGDQIQKERVCAKNDNRAPNFLDLLKSWGGVKILYRRRLIDAPSYQRNHLEIQKALEEGIEIIEQAKISGLNIDELGHLESIAFDIDGVKHSLEAKTLLIAAGIKPNTGLAYEDEDDYLKMDGIHFQTIGVDRDKKGRKTTPEKVSKPTHNYLFAYYNEFGQGITFFGDLHPSYSGSVVKAMASAKNGYSQISQSLVGKIHQSLLDVDEFFQIFDNLFTSIVESVQKADNYVILDIKSPQAARMFAPGQLFRLQPFEQDSKQDVIPKSVPLTGFKIESSDILRFFVGNGGGGASTQILQFLKPGDKVSLMGPVGSGLPIERNDNVLVIGQKNQEEFLKVYAKMIPTQGKVDILLHSQACLEDMSYDFEVIDKIIVYTSNDWALQLQKLFEKYPSIWSKIFCVLQPNMQCMMKGICGQCSCKLTNNNFIYGCATHIYPFQQIDFNSLNKRTLQNTVLEKINNLWYRKYN